MSAFARFHRLREGWREIVGRDGTPKSESRANYAACLAQAIEVAEAQGLEGHNVLLARQRLNAIIKSISRRKDY